MGDKALLPVPLGSVPISSRPVSPALQRGEAAEEASWLYACAFFSLATISYSCFATAAVNNMFAAAGKLSGHCLNFEDM